jgi:hypothetical protein
MVSINAFEPRKAAASKIFYRTARLRLSNATGETRAAENRRLKTGGNSLVHGHWFGYHEFTR